MKIDDLVRDAEKRGLKVVVMDPNSKAGQRGLAKNLPEFAKGMEPLVIERRGAFGLLRPLITITVRCLIAPWGFQKVYRFSYLHPVRLERAVEEYNASVPRQKLRRRPGVVEFFLGQDVASLKQLVRQDTEYKVWFTREDLRWKLDFADEKILPGSRCRKVLNPIR